MNKSETKKQVGIDFFIYGIVFPNDDFFKYIFIIKIFK